MGNVYETEGGNTREVAFEFAPAIEILYWVQRK